MRRASAPSTSSAFAEHAEGQTMAEPGKYVATGKNMWDFTLDNKMWRE